MAKPETLQGIPLFQKLTSDEVGELSTHFEERSYSPGAKVFEEGTPSSSLFIIQSGTVEVVKVITQKETVLATYADGEFFGEMALFEYAPRSATVRTVVDTMLLEIGKETFDNLVLEKPAIAAKVLYGMMEEMSRRLRKTSPGTKQSFFF